MSRLHRFLGSLEKLIHSPKVQGALIAAPFFIGITLLFELSEVTSWVWENVVTVSALGACIGLVVWACWYQQRRMRQKKNGGSSHDKSRATQSGEHGISAHLSFHRSRSTDSS